MPEPLISVVIPAYNHAAFIRQAVRSVLDQALPAGVTLEVLVVDDGSVDDTAAVAEQAAADPRLRVLRQENQGAHAALNRGLALARGRWLTLLNSDDYYHPGRLRALLDVAGPSAAFLFTRVDYVDAAGRPVPAEHRAFHEYQQALASRRCLPTLGYALLRFNLAVTTGNFFFHRDLWERIGPFQPLRLCHDWDFLLRALRHTEPVLVERPLLAYRVYEGNSYRRLAGVAQEETFACLGGYLHEVIQRPPANPLAPCPQRWPRYFDFFLGRTAPYAGGWATLRQALDWTAQRDPGPSPGPGPEAGVQGLLAERPRAEDVNDPALRAWVEEAAQKVQALDRSLEAALHELLISAAGPGAGRPQRERRGVYQASRDAVYNLVQARHPRLLQAAVRLLRPRRRPGA